MVSEIFTDSSKIGIIKIKSPELQKYWEKQAGITHSKIGSLPSWVGSKEQLIGIGLHIALFLVFALVTFVVLQVNPNLPDEIVGAIASFIYIFIIVGIQAAKGEKDLNLDIGIITKNHYIILGGIKQTMHKATLNSQPKKSISCEIGIAFNRRDCTFSTNFISRKIEVNIDGQAKASLSNIHPRYGKKLIKRDAEKIADYGMGKLHLTGE